MKQVMIVGGGAAGLMAAVSAAENGAKVILLEKMNNVGKKLLLTGKERCNITNIAPIEDLIRNMPGNGSFLYSAFNRFTNKDIIVFLKRYGVATKVERGGRVFPASNKAQDVVAAFTKALKERDVSLLTGERVQTLHFKNGAVGGVTTTTQKTYDATAVIICTGGASYPATGSSGDGYILAQAAGHTIVPLKPSLVPLEISEPWIRELQGLSLRNVLATIFSNEERVGSEFGEMLFTHYGLSGPIILSLSKKVAKLQALYPQKKLVVAVNLKPALTVEMLDKRLQRDFAKYPRKHLKNGLIDLLPIKLILPIIHLASLAPDQPLHQVTKAQRGALIHQITNLTFTISKTRPISEALVTAGGVSVKEINPQTMESKIIKGLYFAGEVIDIDGYTGGYNLQAAFSTGFVAGASAAKAI